MNNTLLSDFDFTSSVVTWMRNVNKQIIMFLFSFYHKNMLGDFLEFSVPYSLRNYKHLQIATQQAFTYSKSAIETQRQSLKSILKALERFDIFLVSIWFTLNRSHTSFWYFEEVNAAWVISLNFLNT